MAKGKKNAELPLEERLEAALVPNWEQPYKVPKNWCWTYLKIPMIWGSGGTPSRNNDSFYQGTIPWVKTGELNDSVIYDTDEHITEEAIKNSSAKLFPEKTVLIAMYGATIGKTAILGVPATTNQACACGVCSFAIDSKYAFYYAQSIKEQLVKLARGGAQPNISQEIIKEYKIPLPPICEQKKIVDRIESLFAKLDEAKEKAQAVVDGFEDRKAAIFHSAFSGNLTEAWRRENGLLTLSLQWDSLNNLCEKITDGTHHSPPNDTNGEYMYVTAKNIKEEGVDLSNITYVSKSIHDEIYSRCDVQYGDVLYIKDGATTGIATVNRIKEPFSLLSSVAVLRVKKSLLLADYLAYVLNSADIKKTMLGKMAGIAITRLTLKKIKDSMIPVFPLEEQRAIVNIVDRIMAREKIARENAEHALCMIETMKKSILARAFRGELGTNDPNDESAIELLKKVLQEENPEPKQIRRIMIPKDLAADLKTELEKKIVKLYFQKETSVLSINEIMGVSSKKFDVLESIRSLEQRQIISKQEDGNYKLMR